MGTGKKINGFICFFVISLFSFSQNWQLVNAAYKYNYYSASPSVAIATIWVDSVKSTTQTTYYLNRIIANCDTCNNAVLAADFYDTAYVLSNQPNFLQRKVILFNNGIYNFTDRGNIVIHTSDTLHTSWLFDSIYNISAQLVAKTVAAIFSLPDSVQLIQLSTGDTVILSKDYGILQYPKIYASHQYYKLAGIEGINKGLQTFKFKDFFNFSVGDVFQYSVSDQNYIFTPPLFTQGITKIEILNRIQNTDTISYQVKTTLLDSTWLGGSSAAYTYSTSIDTLTYIDSVNHFTNLYAKQLVPVSVPSGFAFISTASINQLQLDIDANSLAVKRYGVVCPNTMYDSSSYGVASSVDTINPYLYLKRNGVLILGREAKLGLGITSDVYNNYDEIRTTCLVGYVKGTDTVGTITPDAELSFIATNTATKFDMFVFPNPAHENCSINFSSPFKGRLDVYDNSGQLVFSDTINNTLQYKIDTRNFSAGIYLVKCSTVNSFVTRKIIIQ